MTSQNYKDPAEEILAQYEKEEREFRDHWVWKELKCSPEEFFKAIKHHVQNLNLSPAEWESALQKAREASRIRSIERRQMYHSVNLQHRGHLKI